MPPFRLMPMVIPNEGGLLRTAPRPWFGERLALAAARDIERACGAVTPIDPR